MLCRAAAALSLAALLPLVLPSNPESLSLPCNNWISKGRQPEKMRIFIYIKQFIPIQIKQSYVIVFCTKLISYTILFIPKKTQEIFFSDKIQLSVLVLIIKLSQKKTFIQKHENTAHVILNRMTKIMHFKIFHMR